MNKNEAQLKDDYGVVSGNATSILNIPVLPPQGGFSSGEHYTLMYENIGTVENPDYVLRADLIPY